MLRSLTSRFALGRVFSHDAFVAFQRPGVIRAVGEPLGNADLPIDLARRDGDARLVAVGDDLFETQLAVAENSDERDKPGDPSWCKPGQVLVKQASCQTRLRP